jgi:hypothetical protein
MKKEKRRPKNRKKPKNDAMEHAKDAAILGLGFKR